MINFLIERFIWQLIEVRYLLIEVRYLLILWLVLIPSLTIHPENGSLFPQWLKEIPAREQSPSYLMHKIGEYVITYPKINDNTMSLQSRQQNDIKNSTSTASSDKALKFKYNKEAVVLVLRPNQNHWFIGASILMLSGVICTD